MRAKDRFCASCGSPIAAAQGESAPSSLASQTTNVESASLLVQAIGAAARGEHRKVVTVLFADLSGSTPLEEDVDPEDLRRILASYFNQLARQIRRYEGTIDKYVGDAVMAVFGADHIATVGYDSNFGARPLARQIQNEIADPLAEMLLQGKFHAGDTVSIHPADGKLVIEKTEVEAPMPVPLAP